MVLLDSIAPPRESWQGWKTWFMLFIIYISPSMASSMIKCTNYKYLTSTIVSDFVDKSIIHTRDVQKRIDDCVISRGGYI